METLHPHSAIAVYSNESIDNIKKDGGSHPWTLNQKNARCCKYLVCCRSGFNRIEGPEPQKSAFLIGLISDVVPSTEDKRRRLIKISAYARVSVLDVWKGWQNPVRYTDLESLGIDPSALTFEPMPEPIKVDQPVPVPETKPASGPLTIAEAKRGLALTFGVAEESIEITIRG